MLQGYVSNQGDGLTVSIKGMLTPVTVLNIHTDNIANFGVPGYQRKDPVLTSFVEYLGPNAVDKVTSTEIGRIRRSGNPLDMALNTHGYFQILNPDGQIELTRDGRFKLDKDGNLLSQQDKPVMSASGIPVKLPIVPTDIEKQMTIAPNGEIKIYDAKKGQMVTVDRIGIAAEDGTAASDVDMRQGFVEDSNVFLQNEFVHMIPLRRQFETNRQLFMIQSDMLNKMVQELGRAQ